MYITTLPILLFLEECLRGASPLFFIYPPPSFEGDRPEESRREAEPLLYKSFPLSFEGEGDKGGEVDK